jgi:hypothetical protein
MFSVYLHRHDPEQIPGKFILNKNANFVVETCVITAKIAGVSTAKNHNESQNHFFEAPCSAQAVPVYRCKNTALKLSEISHQFPFYFQ